MKKAVLIDAWKTFVTENGVDKKMKKVLDSFDIKKIILTNATAEQRVKYGIIDMPYKIFSLDHNPDKLDPEYYKKMLASFSLSAGEVIYFEHSKAAVNAARFVGVLSYWFDHERRDINKLRDFLKKSV